MGRIILLTAGVILLLGNSTIIAQTSNSKSHTIAITIPEVALLDLESTASSSITLIVVAPNEAGNAVDFLNGTNADVWINYSSITGSSQPVRKVSAFIEGTIPEGLIVNVEATTYSGNGKGKTGTPTGNIILSKSAQDILTNIGSCYTGNGANNGHMLKYSLELAGSAESYEKLNFDNSNTISVLYILSDTN